MCNQTTAKNIQATIINPMIQKLHDNQVRDLIREEPMKIPDASAVQKKEKSYYNYKNNPSLLSYGTPHILPRKTVRITDPFKPRQSNKPQNKLSLTTY